MATVTDTTSYYCKILASQNEWFCT